MTESWDDAEESQRAIADAYHLPDFMVFMHMQEYPLDLVAHEGGLHADNQQRVDDQKEAYS